MLQAFAEKFRRCVRALVLPVVVLAVIFAAAGCDKDAAEVTPHPYFGDASANSPLINAAYSGDTAEVGRLLAGGADVNYQQTEGATALILASQEGHGVIVEARWQRLRRSMCKPTLV